ETPRRRSGAHERVRGVQGKIARRRDARERLDSRRVASAAIDRLHFAAGGRLLDEIVGEARERRERSGGDRSAAVLGGELGGADLLRAERWIAGDGGDA